MREGTASHTARSVAARRLRYPRASAAYGDPAADDALTADVAAGLTPRHTRMHEYLSARTAFFDRVVVTALDRGTEQVVIGGAGYDGRAFRYAKPGVRWFEVDHPATQADKLARIARLGLGTAHIAYIAADFASDPVAGPLREAGIDQAQPALFLFEGVAVYLERPVIDRVLAEFREVTAAGSALAISVSTGASSAARAAFMQRVAAVGEPARTVLTAAEAKALLSAAGWQVTPAIDRQRSAGLLLARAATAADGEPARAASTADPERVPPSLARPRSPVAVARPEAGGGATARSAARARPEARGGAAGAPRPAGPAPAADGLPDALPLSALLAQTLVAFTIEADNEAGHRMPHRTTAHGTAAHASPGSNRTRRHSRRQRWPPLDCRCGRCCQGRCSPSRRRTTPGPAPRSRSAPTCCGC